MPNRSQCDMIEIEFKYCKFPAWFFMHVEGRNTGNISTEKDYIVKPLSLYTREFAQEKATTNFLQFELALLRVCAC